MASADDESARALDDYLLGAPVSKPEIVAALLRTPVSAPAAAPFYRAFEAVGARAADEAFVALRLVIAGHAPADDAVARVRALARIVRAQRTGDAAGLRTLRDRERARTRDLPSGASDAEYAAAARAAYGAELGS